MKNFLLTLAFTAILLSTTQAQVQSLVNFNNTSDLTTLFNPDATPVFTNITDQGIGNTGSINVPLGSYDIWTTKSGYSVSGEGDVYTLSAFFKIKDNSGYGGLGFSSNDTNEPDSYGSPVYGLGMAFHGGGGMFINNRVQTSVSWPPDLVIGNWYKMILKVTALGSNLFDMNFQIWNCDANGVLGSKKTEHSLSNVSNTQVGGATTLHVYFSAAGSRMEKIDNFEINLEGGAVIVEEDEPVLTTDAVSSITASTATCGGNVTDDRSSPVTVRGVCWSTTTGPTTALSTKTSDGTGTGVFTSSLTDLEQGTTYYVRAYATNGVGTSYGAEVSFTTASALIATLPVGSGTSGSPYQIASLENLYWITAPGTVDGLTQAQRWSKYYIQTTNIDASITSTWDGGAGWLPIGKFSAPFTGAYDGSGQTISGLFVNRPGIDDIGLFGGVNNATISNLGMIGVQLNGEQRVGALVGMCYGVVVITNCYSTGSLTGVQYIGGLVGFIQDGSVNNCYSSATVGTGSVSVPGGLVGFNNGNIANCYATGAVTGFNLEGGLVGLNGLEGTITTSYATGVVSNGNWHGGLVGYDDGVTITTCFWDVTTTGQALSQGSDETIYGKTTLQMKTNTTFLDAGWDYTIWNIGDGINNGYPYLDWQNPTGTPLTSIALPVGSGTVGDPYQIATLQNLTWIAASDVDVPSPNQATRWAAHYIQNGDIDASSTSTWNSGAGWSPIGISPNNFTGTYDGDGHTISGLFINRNATDYQGLFGRNVGTISNLGVTNVNITGLYGTGGLVGINYGPISNSYCTGSITGDMATGGLVGANFTTATIRKSYSNASVTGASGDYGGLVGQHRDGALIADCYSTGNVTRSGGGGTSFGGLVGIITSTSTITNSYSTGRVIYAIGVNPTSKGLVGAVMNVPTFTNNFWDTETSLQTTTAGTATGKTTAEMRTNTTFLSAGWDDTIWNMGDGINDGYPYLDWQNPTGTPLPVELSSFSASVVGPTVKLNWNTATEINNYGFEIERYALIAERQTWNKIGFVDGNGNSNSTKSYSYEDKNVTTGKYSYRLKQIDNDGQFEYSKTIEVDMVVVKKFELSQNYPNPFNPTTTIQYGLLQTGMVRLTLYNILGQEIRTLVNEVKEAGTHTINLNASDLNSGVYIYKIESGSFTQTKKMTLVK